MATFQDNQGVEWSPRVTTPVLLRVLRETKITIGQLMSQNIPVDDLATALWHACASEASGHGIGKEKFFERLGLNHLMAGIEALMESFAEAFPQSEGGGDNEGPFGLGQFKTSTNSPPSPESAPPTT